jgi:hypothetical protein
MVKSETKKGTEEETRRAHAAPSCSSHRFSSETHKQTLIIVKKKKGNPDSWDETREY